MKKNLLYLYNYHTHKKIDDNWDAIFGKKKKEEEEDADETKAKPEDKK